jgi:hypothetical protein
MVIEGVVLIRHGHCRALAFAKLKPNRIGVADIGEIVACCQIADPVYGFITSPKGVAESIHKLVSLQGRYDLLRYGSHFIEIVDWKSVVASTHD